jgi:two-component system, LytTR family, sensor kinase
MMEAVENYRETDESVAGVSWRNVGIAFVVWTILGFSFTSEAYLRHYKAGMLVFPAWMYAVEILTSTYIYALFSPFVFYFGRKIPLDNFKVSPAGFFGRTFIHLCISLIFSMISLYFGNLIAYQWQGETYCKGCLDQRMLLDPYLLHRGIIIYWGIVFVGKGLEYFRAFNNEKIRVAQLSSQLSEAQLSALKMQIHPHFLFNTLNSIVGLIQEDKDSAETMTTKLSDFLRMTLQNAGEPMVTLKQEFYFLKTYLDIEKVRFQERLSTEFIYDETILSARIPNLILQPLVENSIKHGISRKKENGRIKISARRTENRLILKVEDNGSLSEKNISNFPAANGGLGLKNTEARLRQIYGENFSLKILKDNETGTCVTINIPFED